MFWGLILVFVCIWYWISKDIGTFKTVSKLSSLKSGYLVTTKFDTRDPTETYLPSKTVEDEYGVWSEG